MKLGYIIPKNKKIRLVTLGCGSELVNSLMGEGSSDWLHSIHILYAKEATENVSTTNTSKFTTLERLEDVKNSFKPVEDVITVFVTATLSYEGQRDNRVNQVIFLFEGEGVYCSHTKFLDNTLSRDEQELQIVEVVRNHLTKYTKVIFAGSFNPCHKGHMEVYEKVNKLGYKGEFQISTTHPKKGKISNDDLLNRIFSINQLCNPKKSNWDVTQTDAPLYLDKYNQWLPKSGINSHLIFVVGKDVWDDYKDEFEAQFKDIDNVEFLVFNRRDNEMVKIDSPLLHRASFKSVMVNLNTSSTKIRKQNENKN